ncbi:MAPEG family protein [Luminiphilus sp.]|nr:MAPEG family protein [Luminiphilus sp.]
MTPLLEITVYFTILTFITVALGAVIRNREWTADGLTIGLGNRDNLNDPSPLGGRAERAAKNAIEASVFFVPLALVAHAAGLDAEVLFGAQIAFWARVAYVPIYLAGIKVVRSLVWMVGAAGYVRMATELV